MNKIINGDCLEEIKLLPKDSVDLVITSPPYNIGSEKKGNIYDVYDDTQSTEDYLDWLELIFYYIQIGPLKSGGRVCINIGNRKNGQIPQVANLINRMIKIKYLPYTTIIWNKRHTNSRTAWGSFNSPSNPSFPTPFEYIIVFAKDSLKLLKKGITDLTKEEFVKFSSALWDIQPETRQKSFEHNAMFPEELPYRLIKMFSWIDATVLDPFVGTGTTCVVAKMLKRNYIGIEISEKYCSVANERLNLQKELF